MVSRAAATSVRVGRAREAALAHIAGPWGRLLRWIEGRDWDEGAVLMVFGAVIGVVGGLGVVVFYHLIDIAYLVFITWLGAKLGVVQHTFYRPLLTAGGLWAAWELVRRFRIPPGQNVADVQLAVAKRGGRRSE